MCRRATARTRKLKNAINHSHNFHIRVKCLKAHIAIIIHAEEMKLFNNNLTFKRNYVRIEIFNITIYICGYFLLGKFLFNLKFVFPAKLFVHIRLWDAFNFVEYICGNSGFVCGDWWFLLRGKLRYVSRNSLKRLTCIAIYVGYDKEENKEICWHKLT